MLAYFPMDDFPPHGVIPSLLTPFDAHGNPDLDLLQSEVRLLDASGVPAVCVGGAAGEIAGSTAAEYREICTAVTATTKRPVIAGIYGDSTPETLGLVEAALSAGASALLVAQPHYLFQPATDGLLALFQAIRKNFAAPVIIANTLPFAQLSLDQVRLLVREKAADAICQGPSDMHLLADFLAMEPHVPVFTGIEELMFVAFALGAEGAIVSLASLLPNECLELHDAVRRRDFKQARAIHERLLRIWRALDHPGEFLARIKFAASERNMPVGVARGPFDLLSAHSAAEVQKALAAEGKL